MCHTSIKQGKNNNICIYCGNKNHTSGNCTNRLNDNREEPKSIPRDLQNNGSRNTGDVANAEQQVNWFPYQDYRYDENRGGCQQTRFDERYNRHYLLNYNNYQPSP